MKNTIQIQYSEPLIILIDIDIMCWASNSRKCQAKILATTEYVLVSSLPETTQIHIAALASVK